MSYYYSELLFDGEEWISSKYFQIEEDGIFHDLSSEMITEEIRSTAIDLGVVIPGFINCHSHSFQRGMAGLGERISGNNSQDSFWTWREQMYHLVQSLNPQSFQVIADWLYVEMLESGYTTVGEFHYLHKSPTGEAYPQHGEMTLRLFETAKKMGIRLCMLPVLYQQGGIGKELEGRQRPFEMGSLQEYENYRQAVVKHMPLDFQLGVTAHSIRAVERSQLKEFAQQYGSQNLPIHIHIAEQPAEIEESLQNYGKRSVEFLLEEVAVDQNWTLVHATHVTPEERKGIAESGAVVGICPITEANLGDGIFPMKEYLDEKGAIAIGSDSHIRIDPFEELRLIEYSQRYRLGGRACLTNLSFSSPGKHLATQCYRGGQRSMKMQVGKLKEGFRADFVVLKKDHPAMLRLSPETLWDELIFAGSRELVKEVYTNGRQVVKESKHLQHEESLEALRCLYQTI